MSNFHILIKDNFFKKNLFENVKNNVLTKFFDPQYSGFKSGLNGTHYNNKNHTWFSCAVESDIKNIIENNCNKIFKKKLKLNTCAYTILGKTEPMPHCDIGEGQAEGGENAVDYQAIIYIRGNQELNKGTGFYTKENNNLELNSHAGFTENRVVIWNSTTWHTPLNFTFNKT